MNSIVNQIRELDKNNFFITYFLERIKKDDYRGVHFSQHNRKDYEFLEIVLKKIFKEVKNNFFEIPRGDYKKESDLDKEFNNFLNITKKIKKESGKMTINSFKKNILVDFDRMGFLDRYDKNKNITQGGIGKPIYFCKISQIGLNFLKSEDLLEKYRIFTQGLDIYFGNYLLDLATKIYYSDFKNEKISIYEFMFILSDKDKAIDKINLLKSYRTLNKLKRQKFIELVKKYAYPKNFSGNKLNKRDFHNWKNQAQDIFTLLKTTIYFETDNKGFSLNVGKLGIFTSIPKRSQTSKQEYFLKHKISKNKNFELHHIIPFSEAKNKQEAKLIDNYKNFIYIKKSKHSEFNNHNNKNIIMNMDILKIDFFDFDNNKIEAKKGVEALYNSKMKKQLNMYNDKLIETIYQISQDQKEYIIQLKS